jgi:surfeit locus 1 family protein
MALLLAAAFLFAGLLALGVWQLQRLAWKQDLMARVEQRLQAAPVAAPGEASWPGLSRAADEYRRVQLSGHYDHAQELQVWASTELGSGYWVLTPLRSEDGGFWLWVNRGFVLPAQRDPATRIQPQGLQTVTGLLRLSEPGGSLLQRNDATTGRWYSRDVAAFSSARGLSGPVAPYFIDAVAEAGAPQEAWPRPGLTVLRFSNNHLVYALTWFALAAMVAGATGYLLRERRRRRGPAGESALAASSRD